MNACSRACGFCGRCDDDPRSESLGRLHPAVCVCGAPVDERGYGVVTIAGVGPCCSAVCADVAINLANNTKKGAA